MAITVILFVFGLAAIVDAYNYNNNQAWAGFQRQGMPGFGGIVPPTPPRLPNAPFMPTAPFMPNTPFMPNAPFMPSMPLRPFLPTPPKILTPQDIANAQGQPGGIFNGIAVESASTYYIDADGKVVKKGGTKVVTNSDGDVQVYESGTPGSTQGAFRTTPPKTMIPQVVGNTQGQPGATFNGITVQSASTYHTDADGKVVKSGGTKVVTNRDGDVNVYESGTPGSTQGAFRTTPPKTMQVVGNIQGQPGATFNGIAVESASTYYTDADGKVVKSGGTKVVTNRDGDVNVYESGTPGSVQGGPEQLNLDQFEEIKRESLGKTKQAEIKKMKKTFEPIKPMNLKFEHIKPLNVQFEPLNLEFEPIDPINLEFEQMKPLDFNFKPTPPMDREQMKSYAPVDNEQFFASSVSSYSSIVNDNGVKKSKGGFEIFTNNNGVVEEKKTHYDQDDEE